MGVHIETFQRTYKCVKRPCSDFHERSEADLILLPGSTPSWEVLKKSWEISSFVKLCARCQRQSCRLPEIQFRFDTVERPCTSLLIQHLRNNIVLSVFSRTPLLCVYTILPTMCQYHFHRLPLSLLRPRAIDPSEVTGS